MPEIMIAEMTDISSPIFELIHHIEHSEGPMVVMQSLEHLGNFVLDLGEDDDYDSTALLVACIAAYMNAMLVDKSNRPSLKTFQKLLTHVGNLAYETGMLERPS